MNQNGHTNVPECGCSTTPSNPGNNPCCGTGSPPETNLQIPENILTEGVIKTGAGQIPIVPTALRFADRLGSWKARWGINRMRYRIDPGLYAVGNPVDDSPVLVSANYKMSFDRLRSQLSGRNAWILVLETFGINVWCAAGKGTFGTDEIVNRILATRLNEIVSHKEIIVPQLGAPGVNMHEVKQQSGFRVIYGPVRAQDLPEFLDRGKTATPEMRMVNFSFRDRIVLIPMEITASMKYAMILSVCFFLLAGLIPWGYSLERAVSVGIQSVALLLGVYLASAILSPALLPWLPGRSFSAKGAWIGFLFVLGITAYEWSHPGLFEQPVNLAAWFLIGPSIASFLAMNFTGASTYTSLSGVRKEMRIAVPIQIACALVGAGLWLTGRFL